MAYPTLSQPFYRPTKHKPITQMTRKEIRKASVGINLYVREGDNVYRNNGVQWTKMFKPMDNASVKPNNAQKKSAAYQKKWNKTFKN